MAIDSGLSMGRSADGGTVGDAGVGEEGDRGIREIWIRIGKTLISSFYGEESNANDEPSFRNPAIGKYCVDHEADRIFRTILSQNPPLRKSRLQKDMRIASITLASGGTVVTPTMRSRNLNTLALKVGETQSPFPSWKSPFPLIPDPLQYLYCFPESKFFHL
jgi:hypothetical protein